MNFTIFTTPKPLKSRNLISFLNALGTWQRLEPAPEIIVFGEDEILDDLSVRVVREYEHNEKGLPFIDDLFVQAQKIASNDILMYTNDDMLFLPELVGVVQSLVDQVNKSFLATGQRWDTDIDNPLVFGDSWQESLLKTAMQTGTLHPPGGKDYFIFNRPLGFLIRHVYVGRPGWDILLVADALSNGLSVIDLTKAVLAIHANHDYGHVPGGLHPNRTRLEEWCHNREVYLAVSKDLSSTAPPNFPWALLPDGQLEKR